ncbi:TolC family protein [Paraburkholderia ferrariae]|uniref:TolC family protein n=1 Tax=Paraburkholderia ferrariae TaxID=386056 RepID=UPI00146FF5C2|nr:TolC family protein [Paraburkholderia ferrariae]
MGLAMLGIGVTARSSDLQSLYQSAIGYDPTVQGAAAFLRAEEMKYPEARSRWLPSVRASGSAINGHVDQENALFPNYRTDGFTFSLSQTIFDWGAFQDLRDSNLEVEQARIIYAKSQSNLILRLCDAYFSVLSAQEDRKAAGEHLAALQEQEKVARENFRLGNGTVVDVQDAEASVAAAQADEVDMVNALQEREAQLASIVGRPLGELAGLTASQALPGLFPAEASAWAALARDNSFDARIQQLEVARAHTRTLKTRYATLPTVTAIASFSRGNANYINGQDNFITGGPAASSARIGIQITIPLFDGLSSQSLTRENLALEDKAEDDLGVARQNAAQQAQQAYLGYEGGRTRVAALQQAVRSAQSSVEFNIKAYRKGVRLNSDVLAAEDRLYSQQRNYYEARITALMWGVRLKDVTGELDEQDIEQLNSLLDAQQGE